MGFGFTGLYKWLRRRNAGDRSSSAVYERSDSTLHSSNDSPSMDHGSTKFPLSEAGVWSSPRKMEGKWRSRDQRSMMIDDEYDMIIVPSDWSVGWMEPHAPEFLENSSGAESSFAVLVPCYSNGGFEKTDNDQDGFYSDDEDFIKNWLASLQE